MFVQNITAAIQCNVQLNMAETWGDKCDAWILPAHILLGY